LKRKFITNLSLLLVLNLLVKPFWIFGIDRTVQNVVGTEEYGFYFSLFNFSLLLNILLDFGITNYNNRNIAMHNQLLSKHLSNVVALKLLLAIVYAFVCFIVALIIGYEARQLYILLFLVFNQFLLSLILYLRSNLSALHFFRTDSLVSVLDRLLMIIICSALLWGNFTGGAFKIEWFVYAQTFSYILSAVVIFIIVYNKLDFFKLHFDRYFFLVFLKQSYPFALLILLMAFYNRIDSVMLERMLDNGKEQAGFYAQSFRILDAAAMFSFLFAGLLLPIFSKMIKQNESIVQMLQLSIRLILAPAIVFVIAAIFYSNEIMTLLYHNNESGYSGKIFMYLIPGFIAVSITYIYGTLLTANGALKKLNLLALSAMILNISLNIILIPQKQAVGAAISSLVTQFYMAFAQIWLANSLFKIKANFIFISQIILLTIFMLVSGYYLSDYLNDWIIAFIVLCGTGLLFAFTIKMISIKGLYNIIRYKDD